MLAKYLLNSSAIFWATVIFWLAKFIVVGKEQAFFSLCWYYLLKPRAEKEFFKLYFSESDRLNCLETQFALFWKLSNTFRVWKGSVFAEKSRGAFHSVLAERWKCLFQGITLSLLPNHAQNNVWVSAGGLTWFANRLDWMNKVKRLIISVRINDKTSKISQNIVIRNWNH